MITQEELENKIGEAFHAGVRFGKMAHRIEQQIATEETERPFHLYAVDEPTAQVLNIEEFRSPTSHRGSVA